MHNFHKFEVFLESLRTEQNSDLITTIHAGVEICLKEPLNEGIGKFAGMAALVFSSLFPNLSHSNESEVKKYAMELPEFKQLLQAEESREKFINFRKDEEEMYNRNVENPDMNLKPGDSIKLLFNGDVFIRTVGEKDPRSEKDSLALADNTKLIDSLKHKVLEKINAKRSESKRK